MTDGGSGLRGKLPLRDEWLFAVLNVMLSGRGGSGCRLAARCGVCSLAVLLGRGGALCCEAGELCYVVVVLCRCQSSRRAIR